MHLPTALSISLFLASIAAGAAVGSPTLENATATIEVRELVYSNAPKTSPTCSNNINGAPPAHTYSNEEIGAAIQEAINAVMADKPVMQSGSGKTAKYPHQNTPGQTDSYTDFDLKDCATASSDKYIKGGFLEYPILRDGKAWVGGTQDQGPDRVLFQYVTDNDQNVKTNNFGNLRGKFKYAAYCGLINHTAGPKGFKGTFDACTDSKGGQ